MRIHSPVSDPVKPLPLVSVILLAYNRPYYLEIALNSVLKQTYPNIEILIGDDSTNHEVEEMLQPYLKKYAHIRYHHHGGPLGEYGLKNAEHCFEWSTGEYINYLCDDDVFHEDKIRQMMQYFLTYENVSLVTSYRQTIDEEGNPTAPIEASKKLFDEVTMVNGRVFAKSVIKHLLNVVGEPTTVLFRKRDIKSFGEYHGKKYLCLTDFAMWVTLMMKGNIVYIPEALSYLRLHGSQNSGKLPMIIRGVVEWVSLIQDAYADGFIDNAEEYREVLNNWINGHAWMIRTINEKGLDEPLLVQKFYDCLLYAMREIMYL